MVVPPERDALSDAPEPFVYTHGSPLRVDALSVEFSRLHPDSPLEWREVAWRAPKGRSLRGVNILDPMYEHFMRVLDAEGLSGVQVLLRGDEPIRYVDGVLPNPLFYRRDQLPHRHDFFNLVWRFACARFHTLELRAGEFAVGLEGPVDGWYFEAATPFLQLPESHLETAVDFYLATGRNKDRGLVRSVFKDGYRPPHRMGFEPAA